MSTNYLFKSASIHGLRGLTNLTVPHFRRVNVIGGLNGSGKSTLLEALFTLVNWGSPLVFNAPSLWKRLPTGIQVGALYTFHDANLSNNILISAKTHIADIEMEMIYEAQPTPPNQQVTNIDSKAPVKASMSTQMGVTVKVTFDGKLEDVSHLQDALQGIQLFKKLASSNKAPVCSFLSKSTMEVAADNVTRFTAAVQNKAKGRVLSLVKIIAPWVSDLTVLQLGDQAQVCGEISADVFVPLPIVGDGALTLASIGLAIMQSRDGAVFLDEFDTAIHYSRLKLVWGQLAKLAAEYNCQLFAATHSRECIQAAAEGLDDVKLQNDLQYMRLDRLKGGANACTIYTSDELKNAMEESWEVR